MRTKLFNNLRYVNHKADLVVCNNCDSGAMLVPVTTDVCPCCGAEGTMQYAREGIETVDIIDFRPQNPINECHAKYKEEC